MRTLKTVFIVMTAILIISLLITCKKDEEKEKKISVTCQGDCHNYSFKIGNETGPGSADYTTYYSYDSYGNVSEAICTGTYTFQNTGNSYQVRQVVNYKTCKYTVTVNGESSCGN